MLPKIGFNFKKGRQTRRISLLFDNLYDIIYFISLPEVGFKKLSFFIVLHKDRL